MGHGHLADFAATAPAARHSQQAADLVKRKSQFTAAADEDEPVDIVAVILTMPAGRSLRRWRQANPFIVPYGLDVDS